MLVCVAFAVAGAQETIHLAAKAAKLCLMWY